MDKRVIFAVAGSGKTTRIIDELDPLRRTLVITYTDENHENICRRVAEKFGGVPSNVTILTYFVFLHAFCLKPIIGLRERSRGVNFKQEDVPSRFNQRQKQYYIDGSGRFYAGRMAKYLMQEGRGDDVLARIERFFDVVCVDEVQDFASNDFNFLLNLARARVKVLMVGDFQQHTYDTSRDGSTRRGLHDNFASYSKNFSEAGIIVDTDSLLWSRRCSPAVCEFISEKLGIPMKTHSERQARVAYVDSEVDAAELYRRQDVVKLFYQQHHRYGCYSQNWGASKGQDQYDEICIALNKAVLRKYLEGDLCGLAAGTRNKLYVALSRSRGNVYLVPQAHLEAAAGV